MPTNSSVPMAPKAVDCTEMQYVDAAECEAEKVSSDNSHQKVVVFCRLTISMRNASVEKSCFATSVNNMQIIYIFVLLILHANFDNFGLFGEKSNKKVWV